MSDTSQSLGSQPAQSDAPSLASVAIPSEHGGWSLTIEPALLGLLVAPTLAGAALALAALGAFLIRTPLKLVLVDRWRGRSLPRTRLARRVALAEAALIAGLLAVATTGPAELWAPLALAAPLVALELWYDARSRSRRLVPELAGTIGIGSVAAAIALAGGEPWAVAAGLWLVIAARSVAAVPFVRHQLRRSKGQPAGAAGSNAAQALAVAAVAVGAAAETPLVAGALSVAGLGAFHVAATRFPPPRVAILGAQEVALGLGVVLATALGVLAP